jgi:glycosyltransferase involved in cell wall biosynthesis
MKIFFFIKLSIIIICLYYNSVILSYIDNFIFYIKINNDIKNFETFFKFCDDNIEIIKKFNTKINPKVSVISPNYNRENFLGRFLKNIQHQSFNDIEIILLDDNSTDNGFKILEEYQKKDKRIKLIKFKRNKGTFITRNIGVLYSKAKYVILPDPDDLISKDIIRTCLYYAEKYKFEMIRYDLYKGNKHKIKFIDIKESIIVYQPELQKYLFYGKNELKKVDFRVNFLNSFYTFSIFFQNNKKRNYKIPNYQKY